MDQFQYEQTTMLGEQKVVKESDEKILEDRISEIGDSLSESEVAGLVELMICVWPLTQH